MAIICPNLANLKGQNMNGIRGGFNTRPHFFRIFFRQPSLITNRVKQTSWMLHFFQFQLPTTSHRFLTQFLDSGKCFTKLGSFAMWWCKENFASFKKVFCFLLLFGGWKRTKDNCGAFTPSASFVKTFFVFSQF